MDKRIRWESGVDFLKQQPRASGDHPWSFDPELPVALRFVSAKSRVEVPLLRHDYFEVCFLDAGRVVKQVQDRFLKMNEGDLFVVGSGAFHRISEFRRPYAREILLYFLPEVLRSDATGGEYSEYLMPFLCQDAGFPHVISSKSGVPEKVRELMMRIRVHLPPQSARAHLYVKTCLKMILALLGDYYQSYPSTKGVFVSRQQNIDRLKPLFQLMDSRYGERITVDDAARHLHMSRSHFMRFFRKITGETFVTYLNRFRTAKAQVLLASTDKSIVEVAQEAGFCDQSYFSRVFYRFAQVTPRDYQRKIRSRQSSSSTR
ncbi:MAG: AraC family transcriptional regulator [Acidobacteria bacterium]|nr:AraC family transcriptional regulator [Acidobacteriota bacterium]